MNSEYLLMSPRQVTGNPGLKIMLNQTATKVIGGTVLTLIRKAGREKITKKKRCTLSFTRSVCLEPRFSHPPFLFVIVLCQCA